MKLGVLVALAAVALMMGRSEGRCTKPSKKCLSAQKICQLYESITSGAISPRPGTTRAPLTDILTTAGLSNNNETTTGRISDNRLTTGPNNINQTNNSVPASPNGGRRKRGAESSQESSAGSDEDSDVTASPMGRSKRGAKSGRKSSSERHVTASTRGSTGKKRVESSEDSSSESHVTPSGKGRRGKRGADSSQESSAGSDEDSDVTSGRDLNKRCFECLRSLYEDARRMRCQGLVPVKKCQRHLRCFFL